MMRSSQQKHGGTLRRAKLASAVSALLLTCGMISHASTLNYPDFSSTAGLSIIGSAYQYGNVMRLTSANYSQQSGVWSVGKIPVANGFTTTFTFQFSDEVGPNGHGADGFTFNVQNDGNNITASEGAGNSGGPYDAIAVGVDTFQGDPSIEPSDNYVKIVGNNQELLATQDLYALGVNVHDDLPHTITITYDGANLNVTIDNLEVFTNYAIALGTAVDADGLAFVGFGARTGGYYQNTDLTSWKLTSASTLGNIGLGSAFAFADFSSLTDLKLVGAAAQDGNLIAITPNAGGQTGGVWYDLREPVSAGFDTTFTFQIPEVGADGFAFAVTSDGFLTGGESGPSGGDSIAVGFDTYQNFETGDPSNDFVKLVGNGQNILATQDLYAFGIDIHDGSVHTGTIHYDGANITVTVDSQAIFTNMALPLGSAALADGTALVGFVGRTGGVSEEHDLLSWNFTPAGNTVTGTITLEGVNDLSTLSPGAPLGTFHVSFRTPGTTTEVYGADVTLATTAGSPNGTFSISGVPAGTYDVAIKGSKSLRVSVSNVTVGSGTTLPAVVLPAGDANNDNHADIGDFGVVVNAYQTTYDPNDPNTGYDPAADFNYDGSVNIGDFGLLVNEFGIDGAP